MISTRKTIKYAGEVQPTNQDEQQLQLLQQKQRLAATRAGASKEREVIGGRWKSVAVVEGPIVGHHNQLSRENGVQRPVGWWLMLRDAGGWLAILGDSGLKKVHKGEWCWIMVHRLGLMIWIEQSSEVRLNITHVSNHQWAIVRTSSY